MFRVDRDVLAEAVAWTARSLPTRPSVPILAGLPMGHGLVNRPLALGVPVLLDAARASLTVFPSERELEGA